MSGTVKLYIKLDATQVVNASKLDRMGMKNIIS